MRLVGIAAAMTVAFAIGPITPAFAIEPPQVVIGAAPPDGPPGPELPTQQNRACLSAGLLQGSDPSQAPPPELALDLRRARALSRGSGVSVAVLDTGVSPNPRLPGLIGGGDYVQPGGDGLLDCDAHGTLIAGIIAAAADPADGFAGVAPDTRIISIRVRSDAFDFEQPANLDAAQRNAMDVRTLARAITHAADLGAGVVVVSLPICIPSNATVDQSMLAASIGYAVRTRGALIIAGAGNTGESGCAQNPDIDPVRPADPRNWGGVHTVSVPGWFSTDVLTVGFTSATGTPMPESLAGPWVSVAAPGTGIESLGPGSGGLINGVGPPGGLAPVAGSSFAAAYVAGAAALLRSRFPGETPRDLIARLRAGAHAPARGVDNAVGSGMIDPVAALGFPTPPQQAAEPYRARVLDMPAPRPSRDHRPGDVAGAVSAIAIAVALAITGFEAVLRRRR